MLSHKSTSEGQKIGCTKAAASINEVAGPRIRLFLFIQQTTFLFCLSASARRVSPKILLGKQPDPGGEGSLRQIRVSEKVTKEMDFLLQAKKNAWKKTVTGSLIIYFVSSRRSGKKLQICRRTLPAEIILAKPHKKSKDSEQF